MIRCPTCDALHTPGQPCPGCLVHLALQNERSRSSQNLSLALILGVVLGMVLTLTGIGALAVGASGALASSSPPLPLQAEWDVLKAERMWIEAEIKRLDAIELALKRSPEDAQAKLAQAQAELKSRLAELDAIQAAQRSVLPDPKSLRKLAAAERSRAEQSAAEAADHASDAASRAREAREAAERAAERAVAQAAGVPIPSQVEDCGEISALETSAVLGELDRGQRDCLEPLALNKDDRASRLLMVDAFAGGEVKRWERLTEYHLTQVGEDADLAYKLALHSSKKKTPVKTLRWVEMATRLGGVWTGDTRERRLNSLAKIKQLAEVQLQLSEAPQ